MKLKNKRLLFLFNKIFLIILVIIPAIALTSSSSNSQTTDTLEALKDNTLYQDTTGSISNGAGQYFFSGKTNGGSIRRGLLAFDIAENIPPCAIITSVTLTLHMSRTNSGNKRVELRKVSQNWGEGTSHAFGDEGQGTTAELGDATWLHTFYNNAFWNQIGGSFSDTLSDSILVGDVGFYTWDSSAQMISDVQSWLNNPSNNYGWLLLGDESSNTTAKRFDTRQNDSANFRPKLTVTYTLNLLALNLTTLIEGFWDGLTMKSDTVLIYLRNKTSPYALIDSAKVNLSSSGNGLVCFNNAPADSYYVVVKHRNSIETWSKLTQSFTLGTLTNYDFTTAADKAFGNNLKLKLGKYCIYSGDVSQDGIVDVSDLSLVYNASKIALKGYVPEDLNYDGTCDISDLSICYNNLNVELRRPLL